MSSSDSILKKIEGLKLSHADLQQERADIGAQIKVKEQEKEKLEADMKEAFSEEELQDLDKLKEELTDEAEKLLTKLNKE
jgi:predicted  nucleic acid-binding Zn-ribbon protein